MRGPERHRAHRPVGEMGVRGPERHRAHRPVGEMGREDQRGTVCIDLWGRWGVTTREAQCAQTCGSDVIVQYPTARKMVR